ncbi:pyridoxamine 5'-phosphate oxidase [Persicitalea jodogahamensis]|uniref:Pyridoxine/pyridoxamine 5'-phosphate oxidase n=1 Tax=Persicitalea jodogahamensis TaxID=402147 RepID=A0A8J3GB36_9BACT|nr:pyridoxamine 5'-phosphate oxidase [Persicitalea jodogahamensis]GHB79305.1 pyridoxine/pyridoxamine 5'-phosphate oxidase [Persicitalea jodogahamensis]
MDNNIADLRKEYTKNGLSENEVSDAPLPQFKIWFDDALNAGVPEPNAMHLSTVSEDGRPSNRVVLLKELDDEGFVFYTNYHGRKGRDLAINPFASLTFFWVDLERQVRIEGKVSKVTDLESDQYFSVRPRGSQIGAWVSHQSEIIPSREILEQKQAEYELQFANKEVPRPMHWGGYRLIPDWIEFWQGRPSRLHDRIRYELRNEKWVVRRLAP